MKWWQHSDIPPEKQQRAAELRAKSIAAARAARLKNPEKYAAYRREWNEKNRERSAAYKVAYRAENSDRIRQYHKENYRKNKDRIRAVQRATYASDPSKVRKREARYKANDPEKFKASACARTQAYRDRNREAYRAKDRQSKKLDRKKNPEKYRVLDHRRIGMRRARMAGVVSTVTLAELSNLKKTQKRCHYCGVGGKLTFDHVQPIAKGGPHSIENIVRACKPCNLSKHARDPQVFARTKGLLFA